MLQGRPLRIVSSGKYLPQRVSSEELEMRHPSIPKGYGERFSGVRYRHQVTFESNGYMGARAAEEALAKAGLSLGDIDLLIAAGATFDYPLPNRSSVIKSEMAGADHYTVPTMDVDATCLSFVSALDVAARMLDGAQYRRILIVSSEIASKGLNRRNPETLTLFGDGAAAFVVSHEEGLGSAFVKGYFANHTEGIEHTIIRGGGNRFHFRDHPFEESFHSFAMNGIQMLKLAKRTIPPFMKGILDDQGLGLDDIDVILPHQASRAGIHLFEKMFGLTAPQLQTNIEDHGNCIAASIPLLLHDCIASGRIQRGDRCLLFGTAAGFSLGAALIVY